MVRRQHRSYMVHAATTDGLEHQDGSALRKLVILFTGLIVLLSLAASLAGALSYGHDRYRAFTTARGETVEVQDVGVYRYSVRALVTG